MSGNDLEGHISSPKYVTPYLEGSKLYMSTSLLLTTYDGFYKVTYPPPIYVRPYRDDNKHHVNSFHYDNVLRIISCETYCFVSKIFLQK